jgi:Tfp pilus assembly protein PilP
MNAWRWWLCVMTVGSLAGCGGGGPSAPVATAKVASDGQPAVAKAPVQKPAAPVVMPKTPEPGPPLPPLAYEPKGRRDPFSPVRLAKERNGLEVSSVKLVGVVTGSQPLALVEAPDGLGYIVKRGDVIGNGRVTDVTTSSVTFAVGGRAGQQETSLTLRLVKE